MPIRQSLAVLLLLVLCPFSAWAQQLHLHHLGKEEGLSNLMNVFVHRAADGRVYVSSMDGLNVYDGREVRVFRGGPETPGKYQGGVILSSFFETPTGDVWFGTEAGLIRRSGATDNFSTYYLGDSSVLDSYYAFFLEQERYLWIKKEEQLFRFDTQNPDAPENKTARGTAAFVRATGVTDEEGRLTHIVGGYFFDPYMECHHIDTVTRRVERTEIITASDRVDSIPGIRKVIPVEQVAWGLAQKELILFDPSRRERVFSFPFPARAGPIYDIVKRSDHELWLLGSNGLWSFSIESGFKDLSRSGMDLFPRKQYRDLFLDMGREGERPRAIWLSKYQEGVFFASLANNRFGEVFRSARRAPESVLRVVSDGERSLAIKTNRGRFLLVDHQGEIRDSLLGTSHVTSSAENHFVYLGGLGNGVPTWDFDQWISLDSALLEDYDFAACATESNTFLLGGRRGLLLVHKEENVVSTSTVNFDGLTVDLCPLPTRRVAVLGGDGYLSILNLNEAANIDDDGGLGMLEVRSKNLGVVTDLLYDPTRRKIWVTASTGLYGFDQKGQPTDHFTTADGLKSQFLQALALAQNGDVWLSCNQGIFSFCPDRSTNHSEHHFTSADGLSADEFNQGAAATLPDGRLAFGSIKGLDVFHPDSLRLNRRPPQLLLRELRIHDRPWTGEKTVHRTAHIERPYTDNTLSFTMAAPDYSDPERVSYAFLMAYDGGETDTIQLGYDNDITLPNLPAGRYRFGFTAANAQGFWNPDPHWLSVYLRPPFWQTVWFRVLLGLTALAIVSLITSFRYRYRLRVEEARRAEERRHAELREAELRREIDLEEQRRNITSRMHNDVGGSLTTLSMLSSRLARTKDLEAAKDLNDRIGSWVKDIRRRFGSFIRMVNPQFDSLGKTVQLLRTYVAELLADNGIQARFHLPTQLPEVKLPPDYRLSLFQAVQEILNNCVKYAGATKASFGVEVEGERLTVTISDNGKTFVPQPADFEKGIGLTSLKDLAQRMNGTIDYAAGETGGTRVSLRLRLPEERENAGHQA